MGEDLPIMNPGKIRLILRENITKESRGVHLLPSGIAAKGEGVVVRRSGSRGGLHVGRGVEERGLLAAEGGGGNGLLAGEGGRPPPLLDAQA